MARKLRAPKIEVTEYPIPTKPEDGYTAAWFDYRSNEICLKAWDGDEPVVERIPALWYCYMRAEDFEQAQCKQFSLMIGNAELCDGGKHVRVYVPDAIEREGRDRFVKWLRERKFEPLEADVDIVTRYLADNPVKMAFPRIMFYDLETDSRKPFIRVGERMEPNPDNRVLSAAWCHGIGGHVDVEVADSLTDVSESRVFKLFIENAAKSDLLVAWNGDAFDQIVLRTRGKRLSALIGYPNWSMVNFLDMMLLFKHPAYGFGRDDEAKGVKTSFSLDNIAETVLGPGEGKLGGVEGARFYEAWVRDKGRAAEYNCGDVKIMTRLESAKKYIKGFVVLSHACNRFPSSRVLKAGYSNDGFLLRYGSKNGIRFQTKTNVSHDDDEEKHEKIKGAFVREPKAGLHRTVCSVDFSSLYPSIIRTFNISPENRIPEKAEPGDRPYCTAGNGARFWTDQKGVIAGVVESIYDRRMKHKRAFQALEREGKKDSPEYNYEHMQSDTWKVLLNSFYGLLASQFSRIYDPECGEAVTLTGQDVIQQVFGLAEKVNHPALYGDTDSGYIKATWEQANEFVKLAADMIDQWVEGRGGTPGLIRLEVEKEFERIFWPRKNDGTPSKKRYAGIDKKGKVVIRGLELARTDGCKLRREFQRTMINYVLKNERPTSTGAEKLIREIAQQVFSLKLGVDDLRITTGLTMPPEDYKTPTPQARIAKEMLARNESVYVGMKIPYVVVHAPSGRKDDKGPVDVVHANSFTGVYDARYYWEKQIYTPVRRLLESVFPENLEMWKKLEKWRIEDSSDLPLFRGSPGNPQQEGKLVLVIQAENVAKDQQCLLRIRGALSRCKPGKIEIVIQMKSDRLFEEVVEIPTKIKVADATEAREAAERAAGFHVPVGR